MQSDTLDTPLISCTFRSALIELLKDFPARRDNKKINLFRSKLRELEFIADLSAASETTLAAIRGAWVLLDLAAQVPAPLNSKADVI